VDPSEPPSTPPEQIEDVVFPGSTPKNQRDLHQKKRRRRSSGIPPMNFNNPDDTFSSSPASGSSPLVEEDSDNDMGDATMDLDEDRTGQIVAFEESSSSARLDEALRQASTHAGAPVMAADETGDMTMEMAEDEATHAFQSWIGKKRPDNVAHQLSSVIDQENVNPFHPATTSGTIAPFSPADTNGETPGDISMDMTRALGVIVQQQSRMPKLISPAKDTTVPKGIKRRRSSANIGVTADSSGSPLKRPNTRRSMSRQLASAEETLFGDATMDLTMAVGGIQQKSANIADSLSLLDASLDETMDFTMAVGGIQSSMPEVGPGASEGLDATALEELSMELTGSLGKAPITSGGTSSLSPRKRSSPAKRASPAKKSSPGKDLMLAEMSDLPPTVTIDRPETPRKTPRQLLDVPGSSQKPEVSNRKSPRKSPRKSMFPGLLSPAVISTPVPQAIQKPAKVAEKEIESSKVSTTTLVLESTTHGQKSSPSRAPASKTTSLVDSIRLLSTPRKPVLPTPVLKASNTPKKLANTKKQVSPRHVLTPLRHSPQKRVRMDVSASPKKRDGGIARSDPEQDGDQEMERISLQDFLTMTNIRFMDLTTTKRRATGHPGADGGFASAFNPETEETEANFENSVAAAVGIVPMLSMYQHSCHEMKSYISSGRTEVRDLETAAYQTQPPLFHEYASAPAGEKTIMDAQFKNLKTNARLQSKAGWHAWRSQLLSDLKSGLLQTGQELEQDGKLLEQMDLVLQEIIPTLSEQQLQLETEMHRLEERKRDSEEGTGDELNAARDQLLAAEKELLEKRALFENLQSQLRENESSIDDARSWKVETTAAIKEAERVSEEFRGWSANEVLVLKGKSF
jgi:kinetochore protein Spc7/SPC105